MTFLQMYLLVGVSVWLLPFFIDRGVPRQWRNYGFAYRVLLTVLVIVLWPISIGAFFYALYKITRAYYRIRRAARLAVLLALDEMVREEEKAEAAKRAV